SAGTRRGGVNLQPEVMPQQTERPPRDSPVEDTPDRQSGAKLNIPADGAGMTPFRSVKLLQPAPLLNSVVRRLGQMSGAGKSRRYSLTLTTTDRLVSFGKARREPPDPREGSNPPSLSTIQRTCTFSVPPVCGSRAITWRTVRG